MDPVVVDCHSHIFNAEDLPIDGFLKRRLTPLPSLLTGIVSLPLDKLAAWAAPGSREAERLIGLIAQQEGLETPGGVAAFPEAATGEVLISDVELDARLVAFWPLVDESLRPGDEGLEGLAPDVEAMLARLLVAATPEHRHALERWLAEGEEAPVGATVPVAPGEEGLEGIGAAFGLARSLRETVHRFVAALRLITRHRYLVAAEVAATYPSARLFVPALVDFDLTCGDKPSTPVQEQVSIHSLLSKLSVVGGIPAAPEVRVHPLVAFCPYREVANSELQAWNVVNGTANRYVPYADPATATDDDLYHDHLVYDPTRARTLAVLPGPWFSARPDLRGVGRSLDIVRHAVELGGFAGVKMYPPSGFLPLGNVARFGENEGGRLDAALRALYAYCVAEGVPILTHAAQSNGFDKGYDDLAAPDGWATVLREFPTLHVCFGHFGHLQGVGTDPAHPLTGSWPARFLQLIDAYPNVYADVGNSRYAYDDQYQADFDAFLAWALGGTVSAHRAQAKRRRRIMFGSDYWMNTLGPGHRDAMSRFQTGVQQRFGTSTRDLFLGLNALRWLGLTGEDDLPEPQSPAAVRLRSFYAGHPLPAWLGS